MTAVVNRADATSSAQQEVQGVIQRSEGVGRRSAAKILAFALNAP